MVISLVRFAARKPVIATNVVLLLIWSYLMNAPGLPTSGAELLRISGSPAFDFAYKGYSPAEFTLIVARYGGAGMQVFRNFQLLDLFFPAIYALLWAGVLFNAFRRRTNWLRLLYAVPLLTATLDYADNLFLAWAVSSYPAVSAVAVRCASAATQLKMVSNALLVLALLAALGEWLRSRTQTSGEAPAR